MRITCFGFLVAMLCASSAAAAPVPVPPIVYSRCERVEQTVTATATLIGADGGSETLSTTLGHTDVADVLPDVEHYVTGFSTPCDLMFRAADGTERVLYDCSSTSTPQSSCSALDAAVSFDAKTIAFTVYRGTIDSSTVGVPLDLLDPNTLSTGHVSVPMPNKYLHTTDAQLYLVDVASGALTALAHAPGDFDNAPAWLSNGRLAFTSTRGGVYRTLIGEYGQPSRPISQVYSMDLDGQNVELDSVHAHAGDEHPFQLLDGRVALSSWQIFGMLPYRSDNGSPGSAGTLDNFFHLYTQYPDGAHPFALFGQHLENLPSNQGFETHFAAHFITQTSDGRVWSANYYRGNNDGLGSIDGFPVPPEGIEGPGPNDGVDPGDMYRAPGYVSAATWSSGYDSSSGVMPDPQLTLPTYADPMAFRGKLSHPAALPDNGMMVTWGAGMCGTVSYCQPLGNVKYTNGSGRWPAMHCLDVIGRDNPGCDTGIYVLTKNPSEHPSDLQLVVNSRQYNEIMAKPVVPYQAIYGVPAPAVIPRAEVTSAGNPHLPLGTPFGLLGASSMIIRETKAINGDPFDGLQDKYLHWAMQGTDAYDYSDADICGLRILSTQPNAPKDSIDLATNYQTVVGERVVDLGEIPVRKFTATGQPVLDATGVPDTSFLVRFPANAAYLMQGIDCQGRTLNTDQTWQHLKPGEMKTCNGCHFHSKASPLSFDQSAAAAPGFVPAHLGEGTVPLMVGGSGASVEVEQKPGWGVSYEYLRDVWPILQARCVSCHTGASAAAGLDLSVPGVGIRGADDGSTYYRLVRDGRQKYVPASLRYPVGGPPITTLYRPQVSKYVRVMNARGSLLYWKAANQRTDGRTDDQYGPTSPAGWNDVDFGANHPTSITPEELGVLSRWIDTGCMAGSTALTDTTPPTLHLAAQILDGGVRGLEVGTVDVGAGIAANSLRVCVVRADGGCGENLAPTAKIAGIVDVSFHEDLGDMGAQIYAEVADDAGNVTRETRTLGFLSGATFTFDGGASEIDAGITGSAADGGAGASKASGCGCGAGFGGSALELLALAFALGALGAGRRRRA